MLPTTAELLAPEGAVARRLDGFEARAEQLEMAAAVERALEAKGHLVVEAGTGIGKSFAYLVPAIRRIVDHNERVVIVTHTISLQEQLVEKDIPLLNAVTPDEFSAVLVKGRGNYVSLRRLKLASERQDRLFGRDDSRHALHVLEDWAYTTRDGTLSDLVQPPRGEVWDHVRSDSHNCMGKKCPTYEKCFYQAARRRMEHGDLLVCNHALFFSDLALRMQGVGFLPPYDHVIIDEAHGVEDVAAEHFGLSLAETQVAHLLGLLYQPKTGKGFLSGVRLKDGETEIIDRTIEHTLRCRNALDDLCARLEHWARTQGPPNGRVSVPNVVGEELAPAMAELALRLRSLRERVVGEADEFELNSYAQRASDIAKTTEILVGQQVDGCVYWVEGFAEHRRNNRRRLSLKCVAVDVAPVLRERLFGTDTSVVLTSATLTTGPGEFEHTTGRLGCEHAETLQLGSPFDHARQMKVIVDPHLPDPNTRDYVDHLVPKIENQVRATGGGAFVLFTSFAMLDRVAERLRPRLIDLDLPVLVHGQDGPPGLLLKRFRGDERSVLLGTASFWQGVDVRGRGLRNVIITRLPFEVPDRPLVEARHERIREGGGNPFMEDQLPKAIIRFKQGAGRLVRSHDDEGRVVIMDSRVATKRYGPLFLRALPEGVFVEQAEPPVVTEDDVWLFE